MKKERYSGKVWFLVKNNQVVMTGKTAQDLAKKLNTTGNTVESMAYRHKKKMADTDRYYGNVPVTEFDAFLDELHKKRDQNRCCDRCSESLLNGSESHVVFQRYRYNEQVFRLCRACTIDMIGFLDGKEVHV